MADHPSPVAGELTAARDLALLADPEQLELIRDQVPNRDAATAVQVAERRGRGRPPGALNKRNAKFRDQLLALAPHPALALARAYSTPVDVLAAQLGCTRLEAAQLGIRAAAEVLPYVEGKQPISVAVHQRADVVMIMAGAPGVSGEQLEAIAHDVNAGAAGGIDWSTVELEDLTSFEGSPSQDVSLEPGD
jgi:hypothetical protein